VRRPDCPSGARTTVKPDIAISPAQAQAIVERVTSDRTVARLSEIRGGHIGAVYEIGLTGGAPSFVLKVYPETLHWKMQKEVNVCELLSARLGVPVPRILLADDTKSLIGLNFVLMTKLDGEGLYGLEATLTEAEIFSIYSQMGQVLREIHRISIEAFGYIGPSGVSTPHASNRAYMSFQFDKKLAEFAEYGGDSGLGHRLRAFVGGQTHLLDACTVASLCHYDFHPGNVLVDRKAGSLHLSGILDFENAIAGDPLMDIAKTLDYAIGEDETKKAGLLAGYGPIERQGWRKAVTLYRLYCVLELWCWMAQIGNREPLAGLTRDLERFL
jgi:aminoglycoside phosphotransferase (APT) family kinase protein